MIGAGPAGLVAGRELIRAGMDVAIFEAQCEVGGVWVYDETTDKDPLGLSREDATYSSLYQSLRTNIPRDLMAFLDYPFDSSGGGYDHWPRFPHHSCVLDYLRSFASNFQLTPRIKFNRRVAGLSKKDRWQVETLSPDGTIENSKFDAVIVCTGHYSCPRVPELPGTEHFQGDISHSHNYRTPAEFSGKRVALWGTSASGFDISNEIAEVADHVYWLGNAFERTDTLAPRRSVGPSPSHFDEKGLLQLAGRSLDVDAFMYCTGYHYDYPFAQEFITVDDNWVNPLYRDITSPFDPTLGFIGLPYLVIPFPLFEIQAKWFVRHLAGLHALPSESAMSSEVQANADLKHQRGLLKRHYHRLGDLQYDYYNLLAAECHEPELPGWFKQTWRDAQKARENDPLSFRDALFPVRGPTVCTGTG